MKKPLNAGIAGQTEKPNAWTRYWQAAADLDPRARRGWIVSSVAFLPVITLATAAGAYGHCVPGAKTVTLAIGLAGIIPLIVTLAALRDLYRFGDELQQRVMVEAASPALAFTIVALFAGCVIANAYPMPEPFGLYAWYVPLVGYSIGLVRAWKRNTGHPLGIPSES